MACDTCPADGAGIAFGIEHALGTDALASDRSNAHNLTPPASDPMGQVTLSFGRNSAAPFGNAVGSSIAAPT